MKDVGTQVYVFNNGAYTKYTLPAAIINDDMQNKSYIVHTTSKTSFDITMHFGGAMTPKPRYYRDYDNHDNNAEIIHQFSDILSSDLWEIFKSGDIAIIYELINDDILKFMYSGPAYEAKLKYHYFEANDGSVYNIKIVRDEITFIISVTNITSNK